MDISRLNHILKTCERFVNREAPLYEIADALEEPLNKLYPLFWANEIIDASSNPQPWVRYQDIINTILLFYAMRPYHSFMTTAFGPVATDYQRKRR